MSNLSVGQITNAWREIFARIFEEVETQFGVSPDWLVNPVTNRRLKLDMLYPQIGVAVRFEGLQGKQRRTRLSLDEEAQQKNRNQARLELCQRNGIELIVVKLWEIEPQATFQAIDVALSRASARFKQNGNVLKRIKAARAVASSLARKIGFETDFKLYAELWNDRQYKFSEPAQSASSPVQSITFTEGMEVEHTLFGPGVVLSTTSSNGDTLIMVDFVTAGQKTLAASLVVDKLRPR